MDGIAVFEELAKADASVAWCVWNGNSHWTAAQLSPEAAHAIHDDPDVITANSTRPSGQAHVVGGGFRLSGRWSLVSGCELATWMVLWSVIHEEGKPAQPRRAAQRSVSCWCLPANARSSTLGRSAGCAAPAATMSS